jgi:hypothetical protein
MQRISSPLGAAVIYLSGRIRKAMFIITSDVITRPQRAGTEGVRATRYAAK